MTKTSPSSRFDGIDTLRGLSIVAVVLHHINLHMMFEHTSFERLLPKQLGKILFWNGANGVTVFFVISGFLNTTMALRRWTSLGQARILDFYRLRFARIVPLLVALLLVLSLLDLGHVSGFVIHPEQGSLARALLAAATFHINWLEATRGYLPANWDVLWSLSNEEMFYLFFPLLCRLTRGGRSLIVLLSAFVIIGPFARTILTHNDLWADYGYLSCMDGIALGCLAAIISSRIRLSRRMLVGTQVTGIAMVALVMAARPLARALQLYKVGLDVTVLALGTCLLLISIAQRDKVGGWLSSPIRWFGRNSYEVYLTHMFVVTWGVQIFGAAGIRLGWAPPAYLAMVVLAGLFGAVVAKRYSEPVNRRLRKRWLTRAVTDTPRAALIGA